MFPVSLFLIFAFFLTSIIAPADEAPSASVTPILHKKDKLSALEEKEELQIQYYKPIYFLYGNPQSKLQLSFRAPLSDEFPLNLAYTQQIFWLLAAPSKPFLDATYDPEFFYRMSGYGSLRSWDIGLFEHNSNGKSGDDSRSYNQSYLRGNWAYQGDRWITQFSGKLKFLYDKEQTNRDIYDYISPLEFEIKFLQLFDSWFDQSQISLDVRPGGMYGQDFSKGGYELGFSFHFGGLKILPAFYIQYYHGYGETLLNYNQNVDEYRAGLMF